jgi:hypothetical protein
MDITSEYNGYIRMGKGLTRMDMSMDQQKDISIGYNGSQGSKLMI